MKTTPVLLREIKRSSGDYKARLPNINVRKIREQLKDLGAAVYQKEENSLYPIFGRNSPLTSFYETIREIYTYKECFFSLRRTPGLGTFLEAEPDEKLIMVKWLATDNNKVNKFHLGTLVDLYHHEYGIDQEFFKNITELTFRDVSETLKDRITRNHDRFYFVAQDYNPTLDSPQVEEEKEII